VNTDSVPAIEPMFTDHGMKEPPIKIFIRVLAGV
jgi:hypothetical protein